MGRTKHYVGSTLYNLAGDEKSRPDFLKTVAINKVLSGTKTGYGALLSSTLIKGPGMNQRKYFSWANSHYVYGIPKSSRRVIPDIVLEDLEAGMLPSLSLPANVTVRALTAVIDRADAGYWHDAWIRENHPDKIDLEYDANKISSSAYAITLDGNTYTVSMPTDYVWGADQQANKISERRILFVLYQTITATTVINERIESVLKEDLSGYEDVTVEVPDTTSEVSLPKLYTYRMGSGNAAFDSLESGATEQHDFMPVIPLRLNNVSIRDSIYADKWDNLKKAYKKLTGSKLDDIIDQLEENESIGDLDYAFIAQGIPLSARDSHSINYLFKYFDGLRTDQSGSRSTLNTIARNAYLASVEVASENRWLWATDKDNELREFHPLQGVEKPSSPRPKSEHLKNAERYFSADLPQYDHTITWNYIEKTEQIGNAKKQGTRHAANSRLKVGQYWSEIVPPLVVDRHPASSLHYDSDDKRYGIPYQLPVQEINRIALYHQHSEFRYTRLELVGLNHRNNVYEGHSVNITGVEALRDGTENEPSGFLVPIHYPTYRAAGLLDGTRLAVKSNFLVINTYVRVRKKWYQTGIFKVVFFIVTIAISVVFAPAAMGAKVGLLGQNAALGASMGFAAGSTTAIVAGAVANGIAAMVLSTIIQKASVGMFGEKLGSIIGTVVSFAAMTYGTQYAMHGNFDVDWGKMMRVDNIMKLTGSVGQAYTQWLNADTAEIYNKLEQAKEDYAGDMDRITKAAEEILGTNGALIDPMLLTDSTLVYPESRDTYLNRTLLTGSDIAELSFSMIEDFVEISKELPNAFA